MSTSRRARMKNALWGLFVADTLAMPAHWFYNRDTLKSTFEGGMTSLQPPPHPHPEAFMVGMKYQPDVKKAASMGRPYDILHHHSRFYDTTYSELAIERGERESEHGNAVAAADQRFHYHHGLKAGDNTVAARLVRVLLRSVARHGGYHPHHFVQDFVDFMTDSERRQDPYTEIYLRRWFENYSRGLEPELCAASQRDIWSIGSNGGLLRPLVLSLCAKNSYEAVGLSIQHAQLTHRSQNIASSLALLVPMLSALLDGGDPSVVVERHTSDLHLAKVSGDELFAQYRAHKGPGNIPKDTMWKYHTEFEDSPYSLGDWATRSDEEIAARIGTACYTEQGVPLALTLAYKHDFDPVLSLPADLFCGGDNVHRCMIHGLIVGAAGGEFPAVWREGLTDKEQLELEIEGFLAVVAS